MNKSSAIHNAESIRKTVARIRIFCEEFDAAAKSLEDHGIKSIEIEHQKALTRGMIELSRWKAAIERAILSETDRLGEFRAEEEIQPTGRQKKS